MTSARPAHQNADDYDSILAAVMETARGRWFVAEFARRNRQIETEKVLDALARIERRMAGGSTANARHPDLDDLAAIFALRDAGGASRDGLTADVVSEIARELGDGSEAIRDHLLKARGALRGLTEAGGDARLCAALDQVMMNVDRLAADQNDTGRRIEALAQVIGTVRDRLRRLIESGEETRDVDPWLVTPEVEPESEAALPAPAETPPVQAMLETPVAAPVSARAEPVLFTDETAPPPAAAAFQGGLPIEPVAPGARLRLAIADEEHNLRPAPAVPVKPAARASGGPTTAAELDRLNYSERYALFAS